MGRRRRREREPVYIWWVAIGGLMVAAVVLGAWRLALLGVLAWCLYEFSLNPTVCRVMTRQGFACHEPVRGRLFACSAAHQRVKNDAVWRAFGLPNPFNRNSPTIPTVTPEWSSTRRCTRPAGAERPDRPDRRRGASLVGILIAVIGLVAF